MADMKKISEQRLLDVVADFEELGGASLGLVAWELDVTEPQVSEAWGAAIAAGWLEPAGRDEVSGEQMWRLTVDGWVERAHLRRPRGDR
jgi:hypothetical protein